MSETRALQDVKGPARGKIAVFPLFLILGFVCYQFVLCFVNTNLFPVSGELVAATEGALLALAAARVVTKCSLPELCLSFFLLFYFAMLWAIRGDIDLAGPRNVGVALLAYALGRVYSDREGADKIVWVVSAVVFVGALAEYFLTSTYLHYFDVLHYYIARGVVSDSVETWVQGNNFVSGLRSNGRNLLPFLGDRRVASVFLEPVSMGNYAIVLCAWGLSFDAKDRRKIILHMAAAMFFIIAGDSRFASLLAFILVFLRFLPAAANRFTVMLLPVLAVAGLVIFTFLGLGNAVHDDLPGRIMRSGEVTLDMSLPQLVGAAIPDSLGDMGVAYSLETFGLLLCLFLWGLFAVPVLKDKRAARYRLMLAVYALAILIVSGTSFYSSKTAALAWFLCGVLAGGKKKGQAA